LNALRALALFCLTLTACGQLPPGLAILAGGVHARGEELVDAQDQPVLLRGVNRSGSEYACAEGLGIFDGPTDDASIEAMQAWGVNTVRVPLNEACWLALGGVDPRFSGDPYHRALKEFVGRLSAHGLQTILELHLAMPGSDSILEQIPMPDRAHTPEFWTEVAYAFRQDPSVIFDPFNEPFPDGNRDTDAAWHCWRTGGFCPGLDYEAAGMQELVEAIRGTGAKNLILLGGVQYANTLARWPEFAPDDPLHNVAAAWHVYAGNWCSDPVCLERTWDAFQGRFPVVNTEIGQLDGNADFLQSTMGWLDRNHGHYLAWSWDVWPLPVSLVSDYQGTPNGAYGEAFRNHLIGLP
jgi:hypothetical protein